MKYTLNQTNRSIQQLDRNIATVQKQVKLGMTGVNTLKSLQAQRESAVASKASLTTQAEALTNTLAIQCGYTTGTQIETSDLPVVTAEQVTSIDYDKDLAEALKNSYAIYSKEYAMQTASDDYENNKTNTLYAYQAAKIDRDAAEGEARPLPSASCIPTCRRSRPHLLRRMPISHRRKRRLR